MEEQPLIATEAHVDRLEEWAVNFPFLQALIHLGLITSDSRVLDVGCGTGRLAWYLALITGCYVEGVEASSALAAVAQRRITCRHATWGIQPVSDGAFDVVYCKDVLPSIEDKVSFLRSIYDVLPSKGCFMTCVAEALDFDEKPLYQALPGLRDSSFFAKGSAAQIRDDLHSIGFHEVTSLRLPLGRVAIDANYIAKHADGSFANADRMTAGENRDAWQRFSNAVAGLGESGIVMEYEWVRTFLVARRF